MLTRVANESPGLIEGQTQFVAMAREFDVPLDIIDVPGAPHAFDSHEPTPEGRAAVIRALEWVVTMLA